MTNKLRIKWIDVARGIAILCVVIGHSLGNYWPGIIGNVIFAFHMPIFFVLSGYLYRHKSFLVLLKNNLTTLIIPYIATIFIEGIVIIFCRFLPNPIFLPRILSLHQLVKSSMYGVGVDVNVFHHSISSVGALWFLLAMFLSSQIFNFIMGFNLGRHDSIAKGCIFVILSLCGIWMTQIMLFPLSLNSALGAQFFLYCGYILKKRNMIDSLNKWLMLFSCVFFVWSSYSGVFGMVTMTSPNVLISMLGGVGGSILVIKLSTKMDYAFRNNKIEKILTFFGRNSLVILCLHIIDLDNIQLWSRIMSFITPILPYSVAIIVGIVYRILFVGFACLIILKIPIFRNLYMPRQFGSLIKWVRN